VHPYLAAEKKEKIFSGNMEISEEKMIELIVDPVRRDVSRIEKKIDCFMGDCNKKFASKLVEKIVYGLVGLVVISVATALVTGVLKAAEYILK